MNESLIMPFGKHKGKLITDLPSSYLLWMATELTDRDDLMEAADEEYQLREKYSWHFE